MMNQIHFANVLRHPGGTTEAALTTLREREVESAVKQAVKAAYQRALELRV